MAAVDDQSSRAVHVGRITIARSSLQLRTFILITQIHCMWAELGEEVFLDIL